ncbi:MAG TPA: hypothetical protein PKD34_03350 [Candidatus Doudnabacteria bacterium]|nr:hypothetical protein [Candidatus Doudnabacteria bacterium]
MNKTQKSLIKIILGPAIVLVLHIIADLTGLYYEIFWLDVPMHFLGGVAIAFSAYYFLTYADITSKQVAVKLLSLFLILALTALSAVGWEIFEYGMDRIFKTRMQPSVHDTMKDLAFGLLGGAIAGITLLRK